MNKKELISRLKTLVAAQSDRDVAWTIRSSSFNENQTIASDNGGEVILSFNDETDGHGFHIQRTGRFNINVRPQLGDYGCDQNARTLFRARKEGWTETRLREIAAKIVHGLSVSSAAREAIGAAEKTSNKAWTRIKSEQLHKDKPCTVSAEIRRDTVHFHVRLPTLNLDECIEVAKFVNALVERQVMP